MLLLLAGVIRHRVLLLLAGVMRLHQATARACSLRVVVYLPLLHKTVFEFSGGTFSFCFGHGGGVFGGRLTWFHGFLVSAVNQSQR